MGKLIVVEGSCDGVGKSTQFNLLREHLEKDGEVVYSHHFPSYDTMQGKLVEEYLSGKLGSFHELSPYLINSLYAIDRIITWKEELLPHYLDGEHILLDRYTTSSLIYQSALMETLEKVDFINYVRDFEYNKLGLMEEDQVIFLTAPFDLVTKLRESRTNNDGVSNDIHEVDLEFMKRVSDNASFIADYLNWDIIECNSNNELLSIEDIHNKVYQKVKYKK